MHGQSISRPRSKGQTRAEELPRTDARLAAAITSKLEAGNFRAAVRLLCSDDVPASPTAETLEALRAKHSPAPCDRKPACQFIGNLRFQPLEVSPKDVIKSLRTFQLGPMEGPTVSIPAHNRHAKQCSV